MTSTTSRHVAEHAKLRAPRAQPSVRRHVVVGAALTAFALIGVFAIAPPPPPTAATELAAYISANAQTLSVGGDVKGSSITRDKYSASPALATFTAGATNYDWAELVLTIGKWPVSTNNVTVLTRWMRQENGPPDWWNRDNPLNNGWGSGGGGGTGTYANLLIAAQNAAAALHGNAGYGAIIAALAASAPTTVTEHAIWASPWSTSHYANGSHWSYTPVPAVKAPPSAW